MIIVGILDCYQTQQKWFSYFLLHGTSHTLYYSEEKFTHSYFSKSFNKNEWVNFALGFSSIYEDNNIIFLLRPINVVNLLVDFSNIESPLHQWYKTPQKHVVVLFSFYGFVFYKLTSYLECVYQ